MYFNEGVVIIMDGIVLGLVRNHSILLGYEKSFLLSFFENKRKEAMKFCE